MDNEKKALEERIQELNESITKLELIISINTKSIKNNSNAIIALAVTVILLSIRLVTLWSKQILVNQKIFKSSKKV